MKPIINRLKIVAIFFSVLMLFQSCIAYKSTIVSLNEASKSKSDKVKIETNNGQTLKFKEIKYENGNYFGLSKSQGKWVKNRIYEDKINNVRLYVTDKTLTYILTFGTPIILLGILIIAYTIPTW